MDTIRSQMVIGKKAQEALKDKKVLIFGLGGVGGACLEALARLSVGHFTLVDGDVFDSSNLNRQILATEKTLGRSKVQVAKERVLDINPQAQVQVHEIMVKEDFSLFKDSYDGVVDCIDDVGAKIALYGFAQERGFFLLSSMGMGNKCHPEKIQVSSLYKTQVDPLARVLRRKCKEAGIEDFPVVFSQESPQRSEDFPKTSKPGSLSFVPPVAGYFLASILLNHWVEELKQTDESEG